MTLQLDSMGGNDVQLDSMERNDVKLDSIEGNDVSRAHHFQVMERVR